MKKIAFIKIGSNSGTNEDVYRMLQKEFPACDIDVIDLWRDLLDYGSWLNKVSAVKDFGLKVLMNNYGTAVLRTHRAFRTARERLLRLLAEREYVFTFQTQSLFDFSLGRAPHFIYTDGCHLSVAAQLPSSERNLASEAFKIFRSEWRDKHNPRWVDLVRHEITTAIIKEYARAPHKIALEKRIFQHAQRVFVWSSDVQRTLVRHYGCDGRKVVLSYKGSRLGGRPRGENKTYTNKNILFVAREWEAKGGPLLLRAFRRISSRHPDATLTVVGCAPKINDENVRVTGSLPPDQVAGYYDQASVFCLPTRLEAFGNVFLEAMSFGLPVVAPRIGAVPDLVQEGQNGYMIEPGDENNLAAALERLLSDPEQCRRFGEEGQKLVRERYTWEKAGRIIKTHIEEVLAAGRS